MATKKAESTIENPSEITCLAEAIAYVSAHIGAVGKTGTNKDQGYKFRPVDEFMNQVNAVLGEAGLAIFPGEMIILNDTARTSAKGSHINCVLISVRYKLIWKDQSDIAMTLGYGEDYGDKHVNKAMAFAYKYLLMEVFHIPTRDLIDGDESSITGDDAENKREAAKREAMESFTSEQKTAAAAWLKSKGLYPEEKEYKGVKSQKLWSGDAKKIIDTMTPVEIEAAKKYLLGCGIKLALNAGDLKHPFEL